ncbi:aldehyde dehydrogenase family protein [uncultured Roseibium sp.]|uniref:aldehyde dehydrogenase family protein n=1 Tax=uncultured Roseibium sp. TaxID=1936171 RepID=UPI0037491D87
MFKDAGVPDGVINIVQGKGDVGAALVDSKNVDGVLLHRLDSDRPQDRRKMRPASPIFWSWVETAPSSSWMTPMSTRPSMGAMNGCFYYPVRSAPPPSACSCTRKSMTNSWKSFAPRPPL